MNEWWCRGAYEKAQIARKEGKLHEAEEMCKRILSVMSGHPEANYDLGVFAISKGQYGTAIPFFKKALESNIKVEKFWLNYIDALIKGHHFEGAKQVIQQALKNGIDSLKIREKEGELSRLESNGMLIDHPSVTDLLDHVDNQRYEDAKEMADNLTRAYPHDNFSWKVLGMVFKKQNLISQAISAGERAIEISPFDAESHFNYGNTLKLAGRIDDAINSLAQALILSPDFYDAQLNLGIALSHHRFIEPNAKLYPVFLNLLLAKGVIRPKDIAFSVFSLLKCDPTIQNILRNGDNIRGSKDLAYLLRVFSEVPVLDHILRLCPLVDLDFESLFKSIRKTMMLNVSKTHVLHEFIHLLSTLSLQCFINEYIWGESEEETKLVVGLESKFARLFKQGLEPTLGDVLCLSMYRALHEYDWSSKLSILDQVFVVNERLIKNRRFERLMLDKIPQLRPPTSATSKLVQEQYEENPFPCWVTACIFRHQVTITEMCNSNNLKLHSNEVVFVDEPEILVAGCGTGQHSIEVASYFKGCQVTAIDLSFASLAYAKRQSDDFGVTNIDYMQGDILDLAVLDKQFDYIESIGVLHHMENPLAGWKALSEQLKPGGLMKIGLYSESARAHIVSARCQIEGLGLGASVAEIRQYRESKLVPKDKYDHQLINDHDFYNVSSLRDLVFHVQEHRFTLTQIGESLEQLGLKFCGFSADYVNTKFKDFHGKGADCSNLQLWEEVEKNDPSLFLEMYQFWCQKYLR
ncbi:methyltransferase domain-containing protein [Porticoccaceae bacterium]|nr:methyltransferase domain-containing protein [Porticoccaceae bacterium]